MFDFMPFTVSWQSSDKEKLLAILDYLENLIKDIIIEEEKVSLFGTDYREPGFWSQVIDEDVLKRMRAARPEIESRIEKAKLRVREMNEEAAYSHGLSGPELDVKLETLAWVSRELVTAVRTKTPSSGPRKSRRLVSLVKKNFKVIEVAVGSILEATGAKTALKEIIGIFTHSFKDFRKK